MYFCTYFDSGYLPRGLALYESLCKTCDHFHLYIVALDDKSHELLVNLKLPSLTVIPLNEVENDDLLRVKPTRTKAEYCWTCGPSVIYHIIKENDLDSCTYLDADLMFYRSPQNLFEEIGDNSIAITDHYAPYEIPAGRYCVQFMYFKNDEWGMKALTWWRDRCIEWCYAHFEDGKYGDQKYLEEFPKLFKKVHVIETRGAGIASWNLDQYQFNPEKWEIKYGNNKYDIVFVHYHALSMEVANNKMNITPATFDISHSNRFLFDYYASLILKVCNDYLNLKISSYELKKRKLSKKLLAKIKFSLRNISIIRFFYERYFRPEYKGYDKKTVIEN